MIEEVNKIIYNMLISGRGVFLPDVGTLFIERRGARKIAADRLLGPRNAVSFSSHEQSPSLVAEIVAIAGCSEEQARDIYGRWLGKTREGATLKIGGVGVLVDKSFSAEASFNTAINPDGVKTLVIRRRSNAWLYAICAVCALVAIGVGVYMQWGTSLLSGMSVVKSTAPAETLAASPQPAADIPSDSLKNATDTTTVPDAAAQPAATATELPASKPAQPTATEQPATQPAPAVSASDGKYAYYVVMGVFSTEQNAARALEQAKRRIEDMNGTVLPFKNKFITAVFGSDKRDDCAAFARSYRDIYPDLWIYNVK